MLSAPGYVYLTFSQGLEPWHLNSHETLAPSMYEVDMTSERHFTSPYVTSSSIAGLRATTSAPCKLSSCWKRQASYPWHTAGTRNGSCACVFPYTHTHTHLASPKATCEHAEIKADERLLEVSTATGSRLEEEASK